MPTPPIQITLPEVFIIESLALSDEAKNHFDGKILYDTLRLHGKQPIYYYFRSAFELQNIAQIFRDTGYRHLHLSCHGSAGSIQFTFNSVAFSTFATIFSGLLNNRRVFISGCSLGNLALANALFEVNGGMYSLTAPKKQVFFDQTTAFWSAFYYLMHAEDSQFMKKNTLESTLSQICPLFQMPIGHYFKNTGLQAAVDEQIFQ